MYHFFKYSKKILVFPFFLFLLFFFFCTIDKDIDRCNALKHVETSWRYDRL